MTAPLVRGSVALTTLLAMCLATGQLTASTPVPGSTPSPIRLDPVDTPFQQHASVALDRQMAAILDAMTSGDFETAKRIAHSVTTRYPDFALAQLVIGELDALAALDPLQVSAQYAWSPRLVNLLLEARRRLEQSTVVGIQGDRSPSALIQAGSNTDEILLVDISDSTLYRYENRDGFLTLQHLHYVSSGRGGAGKQLEGDLKTPIGLYRITESLIDAELPPLYGHGALVLDYPNALDRRLGKTGHGIWLHGNPAGQISRAPYSSEGCVTMTNEHVAVLMSELPLNRTQVVLAESVTWQTRNKADEARSAWLQRFADWRLAWLAGDIASLDELYRPSSRPNLVDQRLHSPALAALKAEAVSILANPRKQGDSSADEYVKMSFPLDRRYPGNETVLWWSLEADGIWRIIAEERGNPAL